MLAAPRHHPGRLTDGTGLRLRARRCGLEASNYRYPPELSDICVSPTVTGRSLGRQIRSAVSTRLPTYLPTYLPNPGNCLLRTV